MKKTITTLIFLLGILLTTFASAATFHSDDKIELTENFNDDVYVAGGEIFVSSKINGDLYVAGGKVDIDAKVTEDVAVAGGQITIAGDIYDDLRIAGGQIIIKAHVKDDVLVTGGEIFISKNALIGGNLIVTGGTVRVDGIVQGEIQAQGGEVILYGKLQPQNNTTSNFSFWEILLKLLAGALGIFVFLYGRKFFTRSAEILKENWLKSFFFGVLYFFLMPFTAILFLITLIGIPFSFLLLAIYIFSLIFSLVFTALILTSLLEEKYHKKWKKWEFWITAFEIFIILKLITVINFGFIIIIPLIILIFGTMILAMLKFKK